LYFQPVVDDILAQNHNPYWGLFAHAPGNRRLLFLVRKHPVNTHQSEITYVAFKFIFVRFASYMALVPPSAGVDVN
jgi:hypothetical protein